MNQTSRMCTPAFFHSHTDLNLFKKAIIKNTFFFYKLTQDKRQYNCVDTFQYLMYGVVLVIVILHITLVLDITHFARLPVEFHNTNDILQ